MRKTLLALLAIGFGVVASTPAFALTNLGGSGAVIFEGHDLTPDGGGGRILVAPSEADNSAYRSAMALWTGGTVDYFDARVGTPSTQFMVDNYDCVFTWANYAYSDNVTFGNNLADFVDQGGHVILGAFAAYTSGNFLSGRIMQDTGRYCPIVGGTNHFVMARWSGDNPECCVHTALTGYATVYRDYITVVAPDASVCGTYTDGEEANVLNFEKDVVYANGACTLVGAYTGQDPERVGNACACADVIATEPSTWGAVRGLYR